MDAIIAKLSTDGQVVFKQFLADMKAEREKNHAPMQSARIKIMIAMRAQPFNADALRSAFAEERALADAAHKQHQESEVAGLTKLSATDRTIVVEAIAKMHDAMEMRHAQHRLMKKAG